MQFINTIKTINGYTCELTINITYHVERIELSAFAVVWLDNMYFNTGASWTILREPGGPLVPACNKKDKADAIEKAIELIGLNLSKHSRREWSKLISDLFYNSKEVN